MTKSDLVDWKRHPVTMQVFSQLRERIEQLKTELVGDAIEGDPRMHAFRAGAIGAYNDILNVEFDGEQPYGD